MLIKNQYPPSFSEPIIHQTLTKILQSNSETTEDANDDDSSEGDGNNVDNSLETVDNDIPMNINGVEEKDKFRFFVQYRGKSTDQFAKALHDCQAPCVVVMTLRKKKP